MTSRDFIPANRKGVYSVSSIRHWLLLWLIALSILGYPTISNLIPIFGLESTLISYPFRGFVLLISLLIISTLLLKPINSSIDAFLLIFLLLYSIRIINDTIFLGLERSVSDTVLFAFAVLIPTIAACMSTYIDFDSKSLCLKIIKLGILFHFLYSFNFLSGSVATANAYSDNIRQSLDALNPISLGHANVTILVACLFYFKYASPILRPVLMVLAALSAFSLVQAGSRGPIVSLIIMMLWYSGVRPSRVLVVLVLAMAAILFVPEDSILVRRIMSLLQSGGQFDQSSLIRLQLQADAIQDFLEAPFFGKYYVDPKWGWYPHNFIIETAMALGMVGLILVLMMMLRLFSAMVGTVNKEHQFLILLLIQYGLSAQFSGAIFNNTQLLLLIGVILALASHAHAIGRQSVSPTDDQRPNKPNRLYNPNTL